MGYSYKNVKRAACHAGGVFLFFLGLYGLTHSGRFHIIDEYETYFIAESLLERGEVSIPQVEGSPHFFGKRGQDGRLYAPYGIGQPILTLPFLWAGKLAAPFLSQPAGEKKFWGQYAAALSTAFYSALGLLLFHLWLLRKGVEAGRASLAAFQLGAGTLLWAYATQYRSNTAIVVLLLAMLLASEFRSRAASCLLAGLALLAILVRTDAALGIVMLLLYRILDPLRRRDRPALVQRAWPLIAGCLAGLLVCAWLNQLHFGDPFSGAYPRQDDLGRPANAFGSPRLEAALALIFSPGKGLAVLSPVLFLSACLIPRLWKEKLPECLLALGMGAGYLGFFSAWQHFEGGWCFGPRFLLPVVPFLCIPLAFQPESRWFSIASLCLLAWGAAVNVLGSSINFLSVARAGDYYLHLEDPWQSLAYNFWHNPLPEHAGRLLQSILTVGTPRWLDANFGSGIDSWWIYAARQGIALREQFAIAALWALVLLLGWSLLRRAGRPGGRPREPESAGGPGAGSEH